MPDHTIKEMSENEQMYLVTIAQLQENNNQVLVSLSDLATALSVQPVSVNQMVRKMDDNGLVKYHPYKGVKFTPTGSDLVMRILRYRRLWEVFFVSHLKMGLDEADALACRFEHATTDDVASRISEFLGNPTVCFHGHPIPQPVEGHASFFSGIPLKNISLGQSVTVMQVNTDRPTSQFLAAEGIQPGVELQVVAIGSSGDLLLQAPSGRVHLNAEMSCAIIVGEPETIEQKSTL